MKNYLLYIFALIMLTGPAYAQDITDYKLTNQTNLAAEDALITIQLPADGDKYIAIYNGNEIPSQITEENDKRYLAFVLSFKPAESKKASIRRAEKDHNVYFKPRVYAELSMKKTDVYYEGRFRGDRFYNVQKIKVPAIHKDHDALLRYEGPGWESEKVGYRFYLDWRNATDIFGKKTSDLVLSSVGATDTVAKDDSYHNMQPWGMDIYKVGSTLGLGSIGLWKNSAVQRVSVTDSIFCEIAENGPVRSLIRTSYFGWNAEGSRHDLVTDYAISAGSRLTHTFQRITSSKDTLVTGFPKYKETNYFIDNGNGEWGYMALYGAQTLVNEKDKLGIAIFYKKSQFLKFTEDKQSHLLLFKPGQTEVEYCFAAAWEQEPEGISTEEQFREYLNTTLTLLNKPILTERK